MTRSIVFTKQARADLDEIFDFIQIDNPLRAFSYIDEILSSCDILTESPMVGVARHDIRPGLRILPLWRKVIVAYELPPGRVDILRVFSGGRDYEAVLRES